MKFVATLLLSSLISVLIVDCHNFHEEPGGKNPLDEAQQTSETVDGPQNPDSVGEAEAKPWKETPLTVTEIQEQHKQKGEGQRKSGLRGKIKGGSKCKVTMGCSLLGGSCGVKANVCSGRVSDYGCKGKGCKCCIPRGVIENSIENMTIQLQSVQEKLIQLESNNVNLAKNLTVAISQMDSKLESNNVNLANNLTVAISQVDSKLESNNVNLANNFTVVTSLLDSKLTALDSKMEEILEMLGPRHCAESEGYFLVGSQCFRLFNDTGRSWDASKAMCENNGMTMAYPKHPLNVRAYIVENIGDMRWVWLGARGDGTVTRWVRTNETISNTDALWHPGITPGDRSLCLSLMALQSWLNNNPTQPFYPHTCSHTFPVLCEYIME